MENHVFKYIRSLFELQKNKWHCNCRFKESF